MIFPTCLHRYGWAAQRSGWKRVAHNITRRGAWQPANPCL